MELDYKRQCRSRDSKFPMKIFIPIIALILLAATPASAQIGIDAVSATQDIVGASSKTWSHTVTATHDTILLVRCIDVDSAALAYISNITWNGTNLTRIPGGSQPNTTTTFNAPAGNAANRTDIWGLLAPTTGTHNIVVTLAAVTGEAICQSTSLFNANQSLTMDATFGSAAIAGAGSGPPQPAGTITTSATFDWVIDVGLNTNTTTPTVQPPSSQDFSLTGMFVTGFGSTQLANTIGTYTMAWAGMTNAWSQSIIAIKWDGTISSPQTYYLAPAGSGGSDTNTGSMSSPWLTRNHLANCGDEFLGLAGTYNETNFRVGTDGPVTCISGNNVRWLGCVTFDACKINIASSGAFDSMTISSSYSGIKGWEVTANSAPSTNGCFEVFPPSTGVQIHHWIFADDIANGCGDGGFFTGWNSVTGVDYGVIIGNIAYNAAQDSANCYSGIDAIPLVNSDTLPGTHYYVAGNFVWGNVDPMGCGGGGNSDGQGIAFDSLQESLYTGQAVAENNISVFNGASGIQNYLSMGAPVYIRNNTLYGNQTGYTDSPCGEITVFSAALTQATNNLIQTTAATACPYMGPVTYYGIRSIFDYTSDIFATNFIYSASGNNTSGTNAIFTNNTTGTNPSLVNPVEPSAPSCGAFASVPACMATMIANFKPTTAAAKSYGYQVPITANVFNPLYPQWLCSVTNLPAGLVTPGCAIGSFTQGATIK